MQRSDTRYNDCSINPSQDKDTLSNVATIFANIGWEKRLCDLKEEQVLGMVAFFQKMRELNDEFTEQGILEFEQSVTNSDTEDFPNDPIPF